MAFAVIGKIRAFLYRGRFFVRTRVSGILEKAKQCRKGSGSKLCPLLPDASISANDYYAKHLKSAIQDKRIQNIALVGDYGTGKSSIIARLFGDRIWVKFHKPKVISLMSLDYAASTRDGNEDKNSKQEDAKNDNEEAKKRRKIRHHIQREILRQLFYGERAGKLRESRYLRIKQPANEAVFIVAAVLALLVAPWIKKCLEISIIPYETADMELEYFTISMIIYAMVVCVAAAILLWLIARWMCSLSAKALLKVGVKEFALEFSNSKINFEQSQDELIYFFRTTKYKVIILEDLDRFNDPLIFEELTRLNLAINSSKSVRQKVTFIYAMRATLMPDLESRSKIFDLNLSIMSFLTSDNALAKTNEIFMKAGFNTDHIQDVIKIISSNVHDMRSVQAICNSAIIVRDKTVGGDSDSGLNEQEAIAMAAIGELCPNEYSKIRRGTSELDALYKKCFDRQQDNIAKAYNDLDRRQPKNINAAALIAGRMLWEYIQQPKGTSNDGLYRYKSSSYKDEELSKDHLSSTAFWDSVAVSREDNIKATYVYQYNPNNSHNRTITKEEIAQTSEAACDLLRLLSYTEEHFIEQLKLARNANPFIKAKDDELDKLKTSTPVIKELVVAKVLTKDYRLYLAPFADMPGSNQLKAFKIKYLERGESDYLAPLSEADVKEILRNASGTDLSSMAFYNVNIFQWLVQHGDPRLSIILESAKCNMPDFLRFYEFLCMVHKKELDANFGETIDGCILKKGGLRGYIDQDDFILCLTKEIATRYPAEVLNSIVNNHHLGDSIAREVLFDTCILALKNPRETILLPPDKDETLSAASFLNYYEDYVIINGGASNLAMLMIANCVPTQHLNLYKKESPGTFNSLVESGCFELNRENMLIIEPENLLANIKDRATEESLNIIFGDERFAKVGEKILKNIPNVIRAIRTEEGKTQLISFIERNRLALNYSSIETLAQSLPPEALIRILLVSKLEWAEFSKMLLQLGPPYSKIRLSGRPVFKTDDAVSKRLISRLKKFNVVSSIDELDNGAKRINMKKAV